MGYFSGWCNHHWLAQPGWKEPLGRQRRIALVRLAHQQSLAETPDSEGMLGSEIDSIKDRLIGSEEVYLSAERRGDGFRLTQEQRSHL